jgi:hypothetical protein
MVLLMFLTNLSLLGCGKPCTALGKGGFGYFLSIIRQNSTRAATITTKDCWGIFAYMVGFPISIQSTIAFLNLPLVYSLKISPQK